MYCNIVTEPSDKDFDEDVFDDEKAYYKSKFPGK